MDNNETIKYVVKSFFLTGLFAIATYTSLIGDIIGETIHDNLTEKGGIMQREQFIAEYREPALQKIFGTQTPNYLEFGLVDLICRKQVNEGYLNPDSAVEKYITFRQRGIQ